MEDKNYNFSEITFLSSDGVHTVHAELYTPKHKTAKGIVQLAHGMRDYVGRYTELANFLCGEGYIFAGNDHLGHGKSANDPDDLGYFAEKDGLEYIIKDMHTMNRHLHETFPTLPLVLFGHSMGSFLTRLYAVRYPHTLKGVVIHGTAGPNPLVPLGKAVAKTVAFFKGDRYRSKFITSLAFGSYNKRFPKEEGSEAWLTREVDLVANRHTDPFTSYVFTASAYFDLFVAIGECNRRQWFKEYPKGIPTLIVSGESDPVGNYGKGPDTVYKRLLIEGCDKVTKRMYEGARHELFNETNRYEVFSDFAEWLGSICK